ncbi:MAG TPA: hypothetical protein DDE71_03780, partial [Tenacibaculum sp.]|nr:hypothetical protein [Tenacibaculum sp.]
MLIRLETTIPKGMALSTGLVSNVDNTKQLHQSWQNTTIKLIDIKDTGQFHQAWYQNMKEKEEVTMIMEGVLMITIMTLMNIAMLHLKLKSGKMVT